MHKRGPLYSGMIMSQHSLVTWTWVVTSLAMVSVAYGQNSPFGSHSFQYAEGTLFPDQYSQAQIDSFVSDYYDQWKSDFLRVDPGGDGYRVIMDSSGRTTSEAQGFGMIILPHMAGYDPNAQDIFDGLFSYARAHPSDIDSRLMDWDQPNPVGNNSAFDGDADIAFGLLLADAQWGSDGPVNYRQEALEIIDGIFQSTIGPDSDLPMLGDWVNPYSGGTYSQWTTRSSDFMAGHFRVFGEVSGNQPEWDLVVQTIQQAISDVQSDYGTGLLPDFILQDSVTGEFSPAPPFFLESAHDGDYWYNAGRVPWRIGVDAVVMGDVSSKQQASMLSEFFQEAANGNPNQILGGYRLDGTPLNSWSDLFFRAPVGVAAMTGTDAADQAWLNAIFDNIKSTHVNYYSDSVTMNSLLIISGNSFDPLSLNTLVDPTLPMGRKFLDGIPVNGGLGDLHDSDDQRLEIIPSPTSNLIKQKVDLVLVGTSSVISPNSFRFRVESRLIGGDPGPVIQQVFFYRPSDNRRELVDSRPVSALEGSIEVTPQGDLSRFINPANGDVIAGIVYLTDPSGPLFPWSVELDQAVWLIE